MRCLAILFFTLTAVISYQTTLAQSKSKTAAWINNQGEEILRDITGNLSIQWQMDKYGTLKITTYKANNEGVSSIVKHYSYLNLYELDPKGVRVEKLPEKNSVNRLLLQCKEEKKACIKSRHYETPTNFKTTATPFLNFRLKMNYDNAEGEHLKEVLVHAIKLFQKDP